MCIRDRDKPVWQQYLLWLGGVVRLDFGMSFEHPDESVVSLIGRTWPVTLHLGLLTIVVAFGIGIPLGIVAAMKQNTWIDYLATLLSIFGFVTPHFVWGILFILTFALYLKWLPTGGWEGPRYWILPVLAYALAPVAMIARYTDVYKRQATSSPTRPSTIWPRCPPSSTLGHKVLATLPFAPAANRRNCPTTR